ncbi:uncharacterized protein DEA37_0005710 [Paragonimus westermani]|uniref:Uncharacterized protein n=1 Tax=Paragonimus westermani TaxID=34504 RepID=A0A5J4NVB0_9TREM|nr:uncharacterized protein DEA37_0005710 [Paragonimus westermani]
MRRVTFNVTVYIILTSIPALHVLADKLFNTVAVEFRDKVHWVIVDDLKHSDFLDEFADPLATEEMTAGKYKLNCKLGNICGFVSDTIKLQQSTKATNDMVQEIDIVRAMLWSICTLYQGCKSGNQTYQLYGDQLNMDELKAFITKMLMRCKSGDNLVDIMKSIDTLRQIMLITNRYEVIA